MFFYLFLLFTLVPLVELALLIWIGTKTSVLFTIALVLVSGVVGAMLARQQGFRAIERILAELRAGRMPAEAVVDGVLILVAGVMLITPGVLTDGVGFLLLVPPTRRLLKRGVSAWLLRRVSVRVERNRAASHWRDPADDTPRAQRDEIIEARVVQTHSEDARPADHEAR